ncbi:arginine deiminase family protein [Mesorhizobium sp. M0590]|uniref:dimethylarginine dimethylaminohydrolase family protein n=1 Tax=Mesorhizobium sp. M0590 TaxID=2956966 RepID=UPI003337133D
MPKTSPRPVRQTGGREFVRGEHGVLQEVALCRPTYYDWAAENAIVEQSKSSGASVDVDAAISQHQELVAALEGEGVTCHFLEPDEHLPMQTFVRDSGIMTPWGMLIAQMARPERRGEWGAIEDLASDLKLPIWKRVTAAPVEGGDVQILREGEIIIGVNEVRTFSKGADQVARWVGGEGWSARKIRVPAHFLHLDVLFSVLNERLALCATEILDAADVEWLSHRYELINVGYGDVMRMGCNVTALGNDAVLSAKQQPKINARIRANGFRVLEPDLQQFVLEGGSTHCLTMPLRRSL